MKSTCFRRLRWNSPWLLLYAPVAAFGLWCLMHQIWNGFSVVSTILGIVLVAICTPGCLACLETVEIEKEEIRLKLGPIVLCRISTSAIRTLVRIYVTIGKGGSCGESLLILSPYTEKELRKRSRNVRNDLCAYYSLRIICGVMPRSEGLWLSYSRERMDQLQAALPGATEFPRT